MTQLAKEGVNEEKCTDLEEEVGVQAELDTPEGEKEQVELDIPEEKKRQKSGNN